MKKFEVGAEINHPKHGPCTITFVGDDYIGIRLTSGEQGLLKREHLMSQLEADDTPEAPPTSPLAWPDCTFIQEPEDQPHYLGSHWEPFYEDSNHVIRNLEEILSQVAVLPAFGDTHPAPRETPGDWVEGKHLYWPIPDCGLVVTTLRKEGQSQIASMYPYIYIGSDVSIEIRRVFVWHSGVEAQIEGAWGPASVTFFDTNFVSNRAWYETGTSCRFILAGIAYGAEPAQPAEPAELLVKQHSDITHWQQAIADENPQVPPPRSSNTFQMGGVAMLLPLPDEDRDDYYFRGTVREVEPFVNDWLGQSGWQVRVRVMLFDDEDADLDVFITKRAWSGGEPPRVDQDIEGSLWLQGRLWAVHETGNL